MTGPSLTFRVGLVQMACVVGDKVANLARALDLLAGLPDDVALAALPEFFNTGYHLDLIGQDFYELAETIPGPTTETLAALARRQRLLLLANIPERDPEQAGVLYDTTFILDQQGQLLGRYRKTHLFPPERQYFRPGDELPVFETSLTRLGTATCFDHAFPEIFSTLANKAAHFIVVPSAVPVGYEYLLNLRTRARAQDNQLWVAAVNRVGREGDVTYCGLSKVVNPRGEVVAEADPTAEQLLLAEIDLHQVTAEREQEPTLRVRRPELYR